MSAASPRARYAADLEQPDFVADPAQAQAVELLHSVYEALAASPPPRRRLLRRAPRWAPVRGAYLWGGVGRGKTYLMDCFHESLGVPARRTHFHRFMQDVHLRYRRYGQQQDPLARVAAELAGEARVLCFDEFFVSDVADAMILARLLEVLFARGITLIATSNIPPQQLYQGGLQRARFLPAIALIERYCTVQPVDGDTDYRLRLLEQAELYHHPLDAQADANLAEYFRQIAPDTGSADTILNVNDRDIPARRLADGVAWFDFEALCHGPRAAADYIELARCYGTVLLSGLPRLDSSLENEARRFLHLVDEFYDRRVKLIISAAVPLTEIYAGSRLNFEYERVVSRLQEMQTHDYLAAPHKPG